MYRFNKLSTDLLLAVAILCCWTISASATSIWLTPTNSLPAGSVPPQNASEIPQVNRGFGNTGSFFIWAEPDASKTLLNWSLNIVSSDPNIVQFTTSSVNSFNPDLNSMPNVRRWELINEHQSLQVPEPKLERIQGFSLFNQASSGIGIGTGPDAAGGSMVPDPFAANNSWLIAQVDYVTGSIPGNAEVFLQIGDAGINNLGEESSMTSVVFGALTDTALNASTARKQNSETPELIFTVEDTGQQNADFDADGDVDGSDFLIWQRGFGTSSGIGDANNDLFTNGADLTIWEQQYGSSQSISAVSQAVPEPSSALLWATGIALLLGGCRRGMRNRKMIFKNSVSVCNAKPAYYYRANTFCASRFTKS